MFSIKESLILLIGIFLTRILSSIRFTQYYQPLKKEIDSFFLKGYRVSRNRNLILVHNKTSVNNAIAGYLLRPLTSDADVFSQVIENEEYRPLMRLAEKRLKQNSSPVILDIGSNIGLASLYFKDYFKNASIVSIEAEKSNYDLQIKNVNYNGFDSDIHVYHNALWINDDEELTISNSFRDGRSWSKSVTSINSSYNLDSDKTKAITLNSIIEKYIGKDTIIDILKIDIEGAEAVLFKNVHFLETIKKMYVFWDWRFMMSLIAENLFVKN